MATEVEILEHRAQESLCCTPGVAAAGPVCFSTRSSVGLNAVNFFLAEVTGVVLPFLGTFLRTRGWQYEQIGIAIAISGLGVFLVQVPAGIVVDRFAYRRGLLAACSLVLGLCYGLLPLVPVQAWIVDSMLFAAGAAQSFFGPLLGALALGLAGYSGISRVIGSNQGWNHAGNLAAAVSAMLLVSYLDVASVFYAVLAVSVLAALSLLLIRAREIDPERAAGGNHSAAPSRQRNAWQLLGDRNIRVLFAATALFHLANAPVMPLVALYVKHLAGSDQQVAAVVLVAQVVMIPIALATGWACNRWGRKPVFAIGFCVLPLRILLYSLATCPAELVALQALDGIGAGIYGVAIVAICADLTHGRGGFNTLSGLLAAALALGAVIGPVLSGFMVQHLGFTAAFDVFALIAAVAAVIYLVGMPETRRGEAAL